MTDIENYLFTQWMGMPLFLWVGVLLLLFLVVVRAKSVRFKFKGRDREFLIETNCQSIRQKNVKLLTANKRKPRS